ncbi:pyridoxamine 5'-phosphate oxidase family protein [Hoeflea sp.]|uniref:pyridoxamine 5'-phosphate oxidase family protein n=1 Tax=Hoeflea sp. TaxID=1940281 RepID=UPI003BB1D56E
MTNLDKTRDEPIEQLFEKIDDSHAVMLGLNQPGHTMQPMAPEVDKDRRTVWFYGKRDSEMGASIVKAKSSKAHMCIVGSDHDYHACVTGTLTEDTDPEVVEKFWSSVVNAWFDEGKKDPNLIMFRFDADEADIWASSGSAVRFAWEIAMANLSGDEPDLGVKKHVVFPKGASSVEAAE